jgi:aryl-alcohol dehydrogenase-like predicted oxidoreductase
MRYRTLGRTGIKVTPYALGAMMFGSGGNPDHDDCVRIIAKALDAGINIVDTADRYSDGESEQIVGKAIKGRRDEIVLATKFSGQMHLALAFAVSHPGVTSALLGPRTMEQLDDLLAGMDVTLSDDLLDRIDDIVPPGTNVGAPDQSAYLPPALQSAAARRRPVDDRGVA